MGKFYVPNIMFHQHYATEVAEPPLPPPTVTPLYVHLITLVVFDTFFLFGRIYFRGTPLGAAVFRIVGENVNY